PRGIPFDGESFHCTVQRSMLDVFVLAPADLNPIAIQQFPPRLFQGERFALAHFLVLWRTFCQMFEKAYVSVIETFQHILNRLRANLLPESVTRDLASQFGDMGFQSGKGNGLARQSIVPFLQRQRMIPDGTSAVDLGVQELIALVAAIETVFVGSTDDATIHFALIQYVGELVGLPSAIGNLVF
ncbi:MAG: hypothetical protein SGI73_09550, partial [Chloroflexota bacterium]|nr:hypothetical protein [Chloroflexota bacterium]